ncbi:MAG: hypothetical protein ACLPKI_23245 [Streptosporangiaceae bacterium]
MHLLRAKIGAASGLACVAALVLGAVPAAASTHSPSRPVTGPEVVYGAVHGKAANASAPRIPLRLWGLVHTSDPTFVLGNGNGKGSRRHTLRTRAGRLTVLITGKATHVQHANPRTCRESFAQRQRFRVLGGQSTGAFAGASGPGAVQIYFAAFAPRYQHGPKRGQCDFASNTPVNRGAVARFLASIVLTRHR